MQLSEFKKLTKKEVEDAVNLLVKFKIPVQLLECQDVLIVSLYDSLFKFKDDHDVFEFLRPILKAIEVKENELQEKDRVIRWAIGDAVNNVVEKYGQSVYTISLGAHQ